MILGDETVDVVALRMLLSHSRGQAIVCAQSTDMARPVLLPSRGGRRPGGVPPTVRIDHEKTAISKGAGARGTIKPTCRALVKTLKYHVDACPPRQPQAKGS